MIDETPLSREEIVQAELERYRQRLEHKWQQIQANRERLHMAASERQEAAQRTAESYLGELSERAQFRKSVRARGDEEKRLQEEILKKQAEVYRQRLRQYLPPDEVDESLRK